MLPELRTPAAVVHFARNPAASFFAFASSARFTRERPIQRACKAHAAPGA